MQNLGGQTECIMGNWKIVNEQPRSQGFFDKVMGTRLAK